MKQTFHKKERLRSNKLIEKLFSQGDSFFVFPFKVVYLFLESESEFPVQLLITVSRKRQRSAVERNRIKRLIREAYRKNKNILGQSISKTGTQCLLGLIYTSNTVPDYAEIERKIILILQRLTEQDEQTAG